MSHTPGPWTIEPHGKGFALYSGRDNQHHGMNLVYLMEPDWNWEDAWWATWTAQRFDCFRASQVGNPEGKKLGRVNARDQRAAKIDLPLQKSVAAAPLHHVVMRLRS